MKRWITSQFRTFRRMYRWWRDQLTTMGKIVFLVMLFTLPTFADSGASLAIAFIGCSVMLMVASSASYVFRPRLTVHASCPRQWMQLESRPVQVEITNRSRLPVYDMDVQVMSEPGLWEVLDGPTTVATLSGRRSTTLSFTLRPLRRGLHRLPRLQAKTYFPLQLVQRTERTRIKRRALILPFYHDLRSCHIAQNVPNEARG